MSSLIGRLRHRITLVNPKKTDNGRGGWKVDYETGDRMEVWAGADILSIEKRLRYQQKEDTPDISFLIRDNPFLDDSTRIIFEGSTYLITDRQPNKNNPRFYDVRAREA